ncbi:MAG: glycoside hydrolase family 3 protein, partial [Microbacteriaceae bacterium]
LIVVPFPGPRGGEAVVAALLDGTGGGRLPATFPVADGVMPVAHDERLETARGYVDYRVPRGVVLGAAHHAGVTLTLRPHPQAITSAALETGDHVSVTIDVQNHGDRDVSLPIPLYGRRHEVGIRPRRRTLLGVQRATVEAGTTAAVEIRLGLDELGSWATGRPIAQPVEVSAWCTGDDDQPAGALVLRVTDENGMTPWDR